MATHRLPIVNNDDGTWGTLLVDWLTKEHVDTGVLAAGNGGHQNVTITAGTTSNAPITISPTSAALLATVAAGAMEYANNNLYFTPNATTPVRTRITMESTTSSATGDILYRDSTGNFNQLGIGGTGTFLKSTGSAPSWSNSLALASLNVLDGSTGLTIQNATTGTKQVQFDLTNVQGTETFSFPSSNGQLGLAAEVDSIKTDFVNTPAAVTWSTSSASKTTAAFTPQAGAYVLVMVGIGTSNTSSSAVVTDNHSNTLTKLVFNDDHDASEIWGIYYGTAPGSTTITATITNGNHGGSLVVRTLMGANPVQPGAGVASGNINQNVTITPSQTGSRIFGMTTDWAGNNLNGGQKTGTESLLHYAVTPAGTELDDLNSWQYAGTTVTGQALTLGYAQNGDVGNTVAIEIVGTEVTTTNTQTLTNKTLTDPRINSIKDANGNTVVDITTTASAVNSLQIKNAVTGFSPILSAQTAASDTLVDIVLAPFGTGALKVLTTGTNTPSIIASNGTSNPDLNLRSQGTGHVQVNGFDAMAANSYTPAAKTSNYSIVATDHTFVYFADASTASVTLTLPAASSVNGYRFDTKRIDGSANIVTINSAGGTIDGAASWTLDMQYTSISVVSNGTNWFIL